MEGLEDPLDGEALAAADRQLRKREWRRRARWGGGAAVVGGESWGLIQSIIKPRFQG
jgi:hypothetical protein